MLYLNLFIQEALKNYGYRAHIRVPVGQDILGTAIFNGRNISKIVALDRNYRAPGPNFYYIRGGITYDFAELAFVRYDINESIEVDVRFYVDYERDLIIGSPFEASVFLETWVKEIFWLELEYLNYVKTFRQNVNATSNAVHFKLEQPRRIGMIQALSLNGLRGRINITEGGLYENNISMNFTSQEAGSDLDYMVAAYSADIDNVNDFRMGLFHHGDSLIHT